MRVAEARRLKAIENAARIVEETARRGGDEGRSGDAAERRQAECAILYNHIVSQWGTANESTWRENEEVRDPIPEWRRGGRTYAEQQNQRWERERRRWWNGGGEVAMVKAGIVGGALGMLVVYIIMSVMKPPVAVVEPKLTREETIRRIRGDHIAGNENDPISSAEDGWDKKDHDNDQQTALRQHFMKRYPQEFPTRMELGRVQGTYATARNTVERVTKALTTIELNLVQHDKILDNKVKATIKDQILIDMWQVKFNTVRLENILKEMRIRFEWEQGEIEEYSTMDPFGGYPDDVLGEELRNTDHVWGKKRRRPLVATESRRRWFR